MKTANYSIHDAKTGEEIIHKITLGRKETEELSAETAEGFFRAGDHSGLNPDGHDGHLTGSAARVVYAVEI